jgi:hypothetical protein
MDDIKLDMAIDELLKRHKPVSAFNDHKDNFTSLENLSEKDLKLLRSIKEEIKDRIQSVNFRYSGSWFYYVCRRITVDEKLKKLILD